jgi:hypothetical protein
MIDKSQAFGDDAPPPYQHTLKGSSDSKAGLGPPDTSDPTSTSRSHSKRNSKIRVKPPAASRWFPTSIFGLSKNAKQVRATTQSLLRDLLSQARPSELEWLSVLGSCAEACNAQGLEFSTILQDPFIEGYSPIYWAILKRPPASATSVTVKADHGVKPPPQDPDALVLAILDACVPLNVQSIADARLACMTVSDNALFVRLGRRYEGFLQRLGTDVVLLGSTDVADTVSVKEQPNSGGAFTVRFALTQFQLRMRVSQSAKIEFIASGTSFCPYFFLGGVNPLCCAAG